ncbi:hypothetical protein HOLleu_38628 [Holothuria leucospilota]|uniref:IgGFc-binding protein N-terminal domain-containing protein n=1 Tax=Holothuria leucospilota TaxID=206669 RepID=A0A9Q0YH88_HOLLE|nr:hypothetical protein HOLleu_38628 [Holothuria leucospilota]
MGGSCRAIFKKQFVFSFLRINVCPKPDTIVQLFIATVAENVGAEGVISFPLQNISTISFTLNPGVGEFINLSPLILPGDSDDTASRRENSSVVVAATDVVLVYGHIRCIDTGIKRSTTFKIRGINELGKDYRVVTFRNKGYAQIAVVALEDDTLIQVINKVNSSRNANITLQMYETYVTGGKFDMTGTYIKASTTVFVLTGNKGDRNPNSHGGGDPFYECLIPFSNWGTHYYIFPPFKMTGWTAIKIMSWENKNVSVVEWRNGNQLSSSALESSTIFESYGDLGKIESSKPILVAQFATPKRLTNENQDANALSMLLVPAIPQFTLNYVVFPVFNLNLVDHAAEYYIKVFLSAGGHTNDLYINKETTTWQVVGTYSDGSAIFRTNLSHGSNLLENRGRYNTTAVVSAVQNVRCYTFALS